MRVRLGVALLGLFALFPVASAQEQPKPGEKPPETSPPVPSWFQEIAVNAFVSTAYSYNFNQPQSGLNGFRGFDLDDNTIRLDVAEVVVQKAVAKPGEAGFRVDLTAGSTIPKTVA